MALQLRVHTPREPRSIQNEKPRVLVRSSDPPLSPLAQGNTCDAIEGDGRPCLAVLPSDGHMWCKKHLGELKEMSTRWVRAQTDAENVEVVNPDTAKQKTIKLRQAVELRRQIRERFYPKGGDTADYLRWILRLETDVRAVADSILMANLARNPTPETPGRGAGTPHPEIGQPSEKIMILRSPLDPRIPINSLEGMVDDGTVAVLKHFYADLCREAVQRLYNIVPDLCDAPLPPNPKARSPVRDGGTEIIRAWFRIMILLDSEAEALEHATKARRIDDYLNGCHASQLEMYCDFFDKAWRPHAVQYLRAAICAQTLAGADIKTIGLLGGMIPSTTEGLKMTKPCWDILYRWFPALLTPWTLASICSNFEDYTTICKLLMMGLYREHWFDPSSILAECTTGVYLGFIPARKGDMSATVEPDHDDDELIEIESRNYVCGQMAIGHPLTNSFLEELRKRSERLFLVVYEGTNADATVHSSDEDLFIRRRRAAKPTDDIEKVDWTVEINLEDVKNDLRMRKSSMYDPIVVDSWQFIIIDRKTGLPFELFDIIQDMLLMLVGDPTPKQLAKRVVREVIPGPVQEIFLEEMSIDSPTERRFPAPRRVNYERNRTRCYNPDRQIILAHQIKSRSEEHSRDANRIIRHVVDDMERSGLISLSSEYETPQTRPIVIQGTDGGLDVYFPYEFGGLAPNEFTPSLTLPRKTCLLSFARSFKEKHPSAIMAKGSIQTNYCAWPMPAIKRMGKSRLNFGTWEGHIYHWNVMPFDRPWSENAWQYFIQHYINSRYPFVMFYLTTFVICALDRDDAEKVSLTLMEETERREWRLNLPRLNDWTDRIDDLKLEDIFEGIHPM